MCDQLPVVDPFFHRAGAAIRGPDIRVASKGPDATIGVDVIDVWTCMMFELTQCVDVHDVWVYMTCGRICRRATLSNLLPACLPQARIANLVTRAKQHATRETRE